MIWGASGVSEFIECDTCVSKPGSPTLCSGCRSNRASISYLRNCLEDLEKVITGLRTTNKNLGIRITDLTKNKGPSW